MLSSRSADTAGRLHIVCYLFPSNPSRRTFKYSRFADPPSFYESSFRKDSDLESGDWAVGAILMRISACAMVASVLFNSFIPHLIPRRAAASHYSTYSKIYFRRSSNSSLMTLRRPTRHSLPLKSHNSLSRRPGTPEAFKRHLKNSR